jgi:glycosyltransferase involved in cell wall biosynthesis
MASAGHNVILIAAKVEPDLAALKNVAWVKISTPSSFPDLIAYQVFASRAYRAIRHLKGDIDILHLNGAITYMGGDVNASHFVHSNWIKSPYYTYKTEGGLYGYYQLVNTMIAAWWEKKSYRSARKVVAVSDFVRNSLIDDVGALPEQVEVIFNGVDLDQFHPLRPEENNSLRKDLNIPDDAFLCFFSGDVKTNRKNLDIALKSVAALGERFHLVVAGGFRPETYPEMVQEMGIANRVYFLGHRSDVPTLLRCADAFLFASHYDPCPLVILEAMSSAVPTITAPSVGSSVLITHGENGFILKESNDTEGMIRALKLLAENPEQRAIIAEKARETCRLYTWSEMAKKYEKLYMNVLEAKKAEAAQVCSRSIGADVR